MEDLNKYDSNGNKVEVTSDWFNKYIPPSKNVSKFNTKNRIIEIIEPTEKTIYEYEEY
jgi:hypothetical protein